MPFIQGTAAGKVALSPFLNFRAEHYWVNPDILVRVGVFPANEAAREAGLRIESSKTDDDPEFLTVYWRFQGLGEGFGKRLVAELASLRIRGAFFNCKRLTNPYCPFENKGLKMGNFAF